MNTSEPTTESSAAPEAPAVSVAPAASAAPSGFSRRNFLKRGAILGAAIPLGSILSNKVFAEAGFVGSTPTAGDISILQFLLAAETFETDLWFQYQELAVNNPNYRAALTNIDPALPEYIFEDFRDERSHADFIRAYLNANAITPIDGALAQFRTLPGSTATGSSRVKRLTNLSSLTIDTSYYLRYRGKNNPDFGADFPGITKIVEQPTIPMTDGLSTAELDKIAFAAAFHFGFIEAGGSSLYGNLSLKAGTYDTLRIMSGIGPTEFYHFATFMTSLQGLFPNNPAQAFDVMPRPCTFADPSFPPCSVLRPTSREQAGAVATATVLINDRLFLGQPPAFFTAVSGAAANADAVASTLPPATT